MTDEEGHILVAKDVTPNATSEPETEVEVATEPIILSVEDLARVAAEAASPEGRLKLAEPIWIPCWQCHLMVAPARGVSLFETMFGGDLFGRDLTEEGANVNTAFLKELVKNCVVKPELTDDLIDKLMEASAKDFAFLAAACTVATQKDMEGGLAEMLEITGTEGQERFFAERAGSMSTPTPV